jgi:cystathionine beta-lyase/cystathionine gamma-synthase
MNFSTKAIHAGHEADPLTGAVSVPIYQTSTYAQESIGKNKGFEYSRAQNPTRFALERNLAALEGAMKAFAFSSGLAALDSVLKLMNAGDHVVAASDLYGGTFRMMDKIFTRFGLTFTFVDQTDPENVRRAMKPNTRMVYAESPSNPMMMLADLAVIAAIAKKQGAIMVVDNTFATPYLQNPIALGADVVLHSSTKYLGGHSDLIGGALMTSNESLAEQLYFLQYAGGAVPAPFECWLLLRSACTLAVRMERHCQNARVLAEWLVKHPKVKSVNFPGLTSHPQHELAKHQMRDFGAMISFDMGSLEAARHVAERLSIITLGESLGGVESLMCHPATMTHASIPKDKREAVGVTDGLLRLSVGIEDVSDLEEDLSLAFS